MTFDQAMFNIYKRAKEEAGYPANIFLRMITERGGLATAKTLINRLLKKAGLDAVSRT